HMANVVARASYYEPGRARLQRLQLLDWLRPAHPRTRWGLVARRLDYRRRLGELGAPTLLLVGRHDPQMPLACSEELTAGIPDARLVVFEQSGHYPFLEEPEAFWGAVGPFLGQSGGSGSDRRSQRD
ncbi:MAG: alpha/beta hydrolase, partial [Chloroflexota bacterium]|nr:alpha/beta hydrolase [Chloroflexota bacterium]